MSSTITIPILVTYPKKIFFLICGKITSLALFHAQTLFLWTSLLFPLFTASFFPSSRQFSFLLFLWARLSCLLFPCLLNTCFPKSAFFSSSCSPLLSIFLVVLLVLLFILFVLFSSPFFDSRELFWLVLISNSDAVFTDYSIPDKSNPLKNVSDLPYNISWKVTKLFLRHESMASLRSKLRMASSPRFQYGVSFAENVTTESESNIIAVFRALKTKLWQ